MTTRTLITSTSCMSHIPLHVVFYLCFPLLDRFCTEMDIAKSGLTTKQEAITADLEKHGRETKPECMRKANETRPGYDNRKTASRPRRLGRFICDVLLEQGEIFRNSCLIELEKLKKGMPVEKDADLCMRYKAQWKALEVSPMFADDLRKIRAHVEKAKEAFSAAGGARQSTSPRKPGASKPADDAYAAIARSYARGPQVSAALESTGWVEMLKAWCAVDLAYADSKFPLSVAFGTLCRMKAEGKGVVAVTRHFGDRMTIQTSVARCLRAVEDVQPADE